MRHMLLHYAPNLDSIRNVNIFVNQDPSLSFTKELLNDRYFNYLVTTIAKLK